MLEHPQRCSVCDPAKIFVTSKFSYLLFSKQPVKLKLGLEMDKSIRIYSLMRRGEACAQQAWLQLARERERERECFVFKPKLQNLESVFTLPDDGAVFVHLPGLSNFFRVFSSFLLLLLDCGVVLFVSRKEVLHFLCNGVLVGMSLEKEAFWFFL
jgi:hypothetical protein